MDVAECTNFPLTLVFLPAADIATFVGRGHVDLGITGMDVVRETGVEVNHLMDLGFGKCKLCVQAPAVENITDPSALAGKRIVTSFPKLAKEFFDPLDAAKGVETNVRYVSGSVEAACGLGLADAVVDLVETGTTMRAAGLEVVSEVMSTQCIMITSPSTQHADVVETLKKRVDGYLTATKFLMISYNVQRTKLSEALSITPGKRSPTISALEEDGWVAVSALVRKSESSHIMDQLQGIGAEDILLLTLQNSRM